MMISTRGRYALRLLVDMAEHQGDDYMPLREIAGRQDISEKYLESIVNLLVKGKVLTALRGKKGGYRLRKSPDQYTVREILELTEGTLAPVACLEDGQQACSRMADCRTLPLWQGLNRVITEYLDSYTIEDLMKQDSAGDNYII
ncbi:MAG: Rrf2 family transcriptional regulator [Lachnospiraceae bacterium]|nr:Rrf2 family transcriptional regulator [Lachnospiraceae bacterium]